MATFVVGDVHGCLSPLVDVLDQLRRHVADNDVVVFLGDYIDRGCESRQCIDAILSFRDDVSARVVCLRGNHEDWLLRTKDDFTRHSWLLGMDALTTVRSYSSDAERALRDAMCGAGSQLYLGRCSLPYDLFFETLPPAHHAFLSELAVYFETRDCFCSHAGLDPRVPELRNQPLSAFIWGHSSFPESYHGAQTIVYGHCDNAVLDARGWAVAEDRRNTIGIDTISHGVLTAIRLPDRMIIQSNCHRPVTSPS